MHRKMEQKRKNFSKLYDQYAPKIYRFIYLKVSSHEIAEDLSSEVFIRVWDVYREEKEEGDRVRNIQAYMYQVARNVVVDHYRKNGKYKVVPVEEKVNIPEQGKRMEEEISNALELERVQKALEGLSDDYQDFIIWRYLEELSVPEIAKIAGKSEESVRVGTHRAIQALKKRIEAGV